MNKEIVKGNWKLFSGKIKQNWGKFMDDDLKKNEGYRDYMVGKLQIRYGLAKDKATQHLKDIENY